MKTILHFFNYDLVNKVRDSMIAPAGYYSRTTENDNVHLYYHGIDDDGLQLKHFIEELSEFEVTDLMEIFQY